MILNTPMRNIPIANTATGRSAGDAPAHDPRPQPPEPPLPGDCCDSGCDPCVNDTYGDELQYYREQLAKWLDRNPAGAAGA